MTIEFENDRVRVMRVTRPERGLHGEPISRMDRLIVYLRDGHVTRREDASEEILLRRSGDVVWRDASAHSVVAPHGDEHEVLIIELKDQVA